MIMSGYTLYKVDSEVLRRRKNRPNDLNVPSAAELDSPLAFGLPRPDGGTDEFNHLFAVGALGEVYGGET